MNIKNTISTLLCLPLMFGLTSCKPSLEERVKSEIQHVCESTELGTAEYTIRKVVSFKGEGKGIDYLKVGDRMIIFTCRAYLKAGVDLSKLSMDDVKINEKAKEITVNLPAVKLLSMNMPAEEIVLNFEKVSLTRSNFTAEERNGFLQQGEEAIKEAVNEIGILDDAKKNTTDFFFAMFKQLGFETITINFKEEANNGQA